jgi:hypothetical protein
LLSPPLSAASKLSCSNRSDVSEAASMEGKAPHTPQMGVFDPHIWEGRATDPFDSKESLSL